MLSEMDAMDTVEARVYKALDKLEAVISHNESDIRTWIPLEYNLQLTYGAENVQFSEYLKGLKAEIDKWTREKSVMSLIKTLIFGGDGIQYETEDR